MALCCTIFIHYITLALDYNTLKLHFDRDQWNIFLYETMQAYEVIPPESASTVAQWLLTNEVRKSLPRVSYTSWIEFIFGGGGDGYVIFMLV